MHANLQGLKMYYERGFSWPNRSAKVKNILQGVHCRHEATISTHPSNLLLFFKLRFNVYFCGQLVEERTRRIRFSYNYSMSLT